MSEKRRDNKGRVLRSGESQRRESSYMYRYTDLRGKRQCIYASTLAELREKEDVVNQQLREGIHLAETEGMKNTVYDSSLLSDGLMAFNLYKRGEFPEEEFRLYQELSQNMQANVSGHPFRGFPDVIIYLKGSFELMLEHIESRGRDMETIDDDKKDYYHSVWKTYDNWYQSYAQSPVITIDMDKYDYVNNSKDRRNVIEYIESKLNDFGLLSDNELAGLYMAHDIKDNKVEIGDAPTDWTPAPEDMLNKIVK